MALFPDVQSKVFEEVRSLWPDERHVFEAEDVSHFSTCSQCSTDPFVPSVIRKFLKTSERLLKVFGIIVDNFKQGIHAGCVSRELEALSSRSPSA